MKIYTKKGDSGQTGLYGGERVAKDHLRIQSYGTLDELNAVLGMVMAAVPGLASLSLKETLIRIQGELFDLGAELATPREKSAGSNTQKIGSVEIEPLEKEIDSMEGVLQPLKTFILPGGSFVSSLLHFARTVSRRAERELVTLHRAEALRAEVLQYVNRLSDFLFVAARFANQEAHVQDVPWLSDRKKRT